MGNLCLYPGGQHRNTALVSRNCDDQCILTLDDPLDTTVPLTTSFDRYVDGKAGPRDGLLVQYRVAGGAWTTLASYTGANDEDTDYWEHNVIGLCIQDSSADLRFVAGSNGDDEVVMLDNIWIMPPPAGTICPAIAVQHPSPPWPVPLRLCPQTDTAP